MCNKMSDVRLSNASPTVERVDARLPDNVRASVSRNLFGRPDPEEIRRYVEASIQEDVQRFTETYNYDPVSDRPLSPRRYEWQEDSDAPEFYSRAPHGSQPPQDAEERSERRPERARRDGGRKRRSGDSGPCSGECQSKRSHTDEDDDDDQSDGAGSQAVQAAEERPRRPERNEVQ
ncbi:cyclin-dependent kinase inhibitor 1B-like [Epinephelus moara]|uniref:cyclin-dependent kinase inhibitor 1B-like n=1 Tax=Epinephelus moara TaxID=300413 RepID=UPI00214E238B|nr:cyclin-dependent kinase inhibitor 1B-like [Epinephelus moara]